MKPTHFTAQESFQIGAANENDHEQTGPRFFMVPHSLKFCSLSYLHWWFSTNLQNILPVLKLMG